MTTPPPEPKETAPPTALFGLLLLVGGVVVIIDAARLRDSSAAVGPGAVPTVVGVLLGVVGAGLVVQARSALRRLGAAPTAAGRWLRVAALVATLLAFAVLLPVLGYVVCSTGLFVAAALLLGAPRRWTVLGYGWALAAIVFLVFDRVIGLSLPTGPWGF
ncbi:tripartite tricarboxylate transporter TctB family protein [Pseudonocardia acaciae]|uniref:tripartite tricarboxylate transporter TctB family protein n=1 Tax=Pseudonocardia acaciae TaxID=551276 RepID=UPI00049017D3|nr:tripartite tricarboxylate transporter TctB family protein [Pseudonocardia acaciae]